MRKGLVLALLATITLQTVPQQNQNLEQNLNLSENPHLKLHAETIAASVWPRSQPIYVCWENPTPAYKDDMALVRKSIEESWEGYSQLQFSGWGRCASANRGIRILIDDSGPLTREIGRNLESVQNGLLQGMKNGMVLNFTFRNWSPTCQQTHDLCVKSIAMHEFGHAIGLVHEQNRPNAPGECWYLKQGSNGDTALTPYDKDSIMNYCNSSWNTQAKLSALDIDAVQTLYGKPPAQSSTLNEFLPNPRLSDLITYQRRSP
jgi:hypothetical protein